MNITEIFIYGLSLVVCYIILLGANSGLGKVTALELAKKGILYLLSLDYVNLTSLKIKNRSYSSYPLSQRQERGGGCFRTPN